MDDTPDQTPDDQPDQTPDFIEIDPRGCVPLVGPRTVRTCEAPHRSPFIVPIPDNLPLMGPRIARVTII